MIETCELYGYWHSYWYIHRFYVIGLALGSLLLAVAIFLLIRFLRRKNQRTPSQEVLFMLDNAHLDRYGEDYKAMLFYISDVLKQYIQKQFGYNVQGATDYEVLQLLKLSGFSPDMSAGLEEIVSIALFPKFAGKVTANDVKKIQNLAILWVKTSSPS